MAKIMNNNIYYGAETKGFKDPESYDEVSANFTRVFIYSCVFEFIICELIVVNA